MYIILSKSGWYLLIKCSKCFTCTISCNPHKRVPFLGRRENCGRGFMEFTWTPQSWDIDRSPGCVTTESYSRPSFFRAFPEVQTACFICTVYCRYGMWLFMLNWNIKYNPKWGRPNITCKDTEARGSVMDLGETDIFIWSRASVKESAGNERSQIIHESLVYLANIYWDSAKYRRSK